MQPDVVWLVDGLNDALVVALVGHKVKMVGVDQQDAHVVLLLTQKIEITLLDVLKIGVTDLLLVTAATLANVGLQSLHIGIEIHQQLGLGHIRENDVEETGEQLTVLGRCAKAR